MNTTQTLKRKYISRASVVSQGQGWIVRVPNFGTRYISDSRNSHHTPGSSQAQSDSLKNAMELRNELLQVHVAKIMES